MLKKRVLLAMAVAVLGGSVARVSGGNSINKDNWVNHPQIVEIRAIYNEIEQAIGEKRLKEKKKVFEYEGPEKPTLKAVFFDEANTVRKYIREGGSDDSALTYSFYYDAQKALRFVFIEGGAVCGSVMEHRIYFDSNGARIWEISKYLKGPEGCWPERWPDNALAFDPWKEFNED